MTDSSVSRETPSTPDAGAEGVRACPPAAGRAVRRAAGHRGRGPRPDRAARGAAAVGPAPAELRGARRAAPRGRHRLRHRLRAPACPGLVLAIARPGPADHAGRAAAAPDHLPRRGRGRAGARPTSRSSAGARRPCTGSVASTSSPRARWPRWSGCWAGRCRWCPHRGAGGDEGVARSPRRSPRPRRCCGASAARAPDGARARATELLVIPHLRRAGGLGRSGRGYLGRLRRGRRARARRVHAGARPRGGGGTREGRLRSTRRPPEPGVT